MRDERNEAGRVGGAGCPARDDAQGAGGKTSAQGADERPGARSADERPDILAPDWVPVHRARPHPDRARQFMPFAALKGYDELVREQELVASNDPTAPQSDDARQPDDRSIPSPG